MFDSLASDRIVVLGLVFTAIVVLAISVIVPTVGQDGRAARNIRRRLRDVMDDQELAVQSLLRQQYLKELSPLERWFEGLPGMEKLSRSLEQAGRNTRAYRLVMQALIFSLLVAGVLHLMGASPKFYVVAGLSVLVLPFWLVSIQRNRRVARFDDQLPEALESMSRALQAGHPFLETFKLIGEEMPDPIGAEFRRVFNDINYGTLPKTAYLSMLERVPSVSLNALITAVIIQQESGGRMAEILDKIADVIRGRFRLARRVRSLSAEGRMSAWVLILLPFGLGVMMSLNDPEYLPQLLEHPQGMEWVTRAGLLMIAGILWIRKIINIKV